MEINTLQFSIYIFLILLNLALGIKMANKSFTICFGKFDITRTFMRILSFALVAFVIYLAIVNTNLPDINNYERMYNDTSLCSDKGFVIVMQFFRNLNIDFYTFRAIILVVSFGMMLVGIGKFDQYRNISIAVYSLFPLPYDLIQFRNFFAASIVIFCIPFLFSKSKANIIKYIFGVIIASSIHSLAIVYGLLVLTFLDYGKPKVRRIFAMIFSFSLLASAIIKSIPSLYYALLVRMGEYAGESKLMNYTISSVRWGFIIFFIFEILFIVAARWLYKSTFCDNYGCNDCECIMNENNKELISYLLRMNIVLCCAFPLLLINSLFFRIYRSIYIVNYSMFGLAFWGSIYDKTQRRAIIFLTILVCVIAVWTYSSDTSEVFLTLFQQR